MATASPSISASVEVLELRFMTELATEIAPIAVPTPNSAVNSGSPAATSEPNVMTRTTAAMPMPMSSVALCPASSATALPPMLTARPAFSPCAEMSFSASCEALLTSDCGTL